MGVVLLSFSMALERVVGLFLTLAAAIWNSFIRCLDFLHPKSMAAEKALEQQLQNAESQLLWEQHRTASTNDLINLAARVMESGLQSRIARF